MLDIYTDASYREGRTKFGISTFMIDYNRDIEISIPCTLYKDKCEKYLSEYMKKNNKFEVHYMELISILYALKYFRRYINKNDVTIETVNLYTDSMVAYDHINIKKRLKKKYKKKKFNTIINHIHNFIVSIQNDFNIDVDVRHIKAHCGVYGNEKADKLAKKTYKK